MYVCDSSSIFCFDLLHSPHALFFFNVNHLRGVFFLHNSTLSGFSDLPSFCFFVSILFCCRRSFSCFFFSFSSAHSPTVMAHTTPENVTSDMFSTTKTLHSGAWFMGHNTKQKQKSEKQRWLSCAVVIFRAPCVTGRKKRENKRKREEEKKSDSLFPSAVVPKKTTHTLDDLLCVFFRVQYCRLVTDFLSPPVCDGSWGRERGIHAGGGGRGGATARFCFPLRQLSFLAWKYFVSERRQQQRDNRQRERRKREEGE